MAADDLPQCAKMAGDDRLWPHPAGRTGASHRRPIGNQRTCRRNNTPASIVAQAQPGTSQVAAFPASLSPSVVMFCSAVKNSRPATLALYFILFAERRTSVETQGCTPNPGGSLSMITDFIFGP